MLLSPGAFAVDSYQPRALQGKTLLILGDSYCAGYGLEDPKTAWPYLLAEQYDLNYLDLAISGSTLAAGDFGRDPMSERVKDIPDEPIDIILIQGGSNDWSTSADIGTLGLRQTETLLGALNTILDTLEKTHPESRLICFTPWVSNGTTNQREAETTSYTKAMKDLCGRRGVLCYDASDAGENGIHMDQASFRAEYCLSVNDRWHLNEKGQALFASYFGSWLEQALPYSAEQYADLLCASDDLLAAVSRVNQEGLMLGTSQRLFSPTSAATRQTLAVTLYRLAGRPGSEEGGEETAQAVSWAVSQGYLTDTVPFSQSLRREELATALYAFYLDKLQEEPKSVMGLSRFTDREELTGASALAFGWALSEELLPIYETKCKPQATVSRGQLAIALSKMISLV